MTDVRFASTLCWRPSEVANYLNAFHESGHKILDYQVSSGMDRTVMYHVVTVRYTMDKVVEQ